MEVLKMFTKNNFAISLHVKFFLNDRSCNWTRMHSTRMRTARYSDSMGVPAETLPGQRPPPEGTWNQATRQEVTSYREPPRQSNTCKNITLPQTSFACGKKTCFKIREIPVILSTCMCDRISDFCRTSFQSDHRPRTVLMPYKWCWPS